MSFAKRISTDNLATPRVLVGSGTEVFGIMATNFNGFNVLISGGPSYFPTSGPHPEQFLRYIIPASGTLHFSDLNFIAHHGLRFSSNATGGLNAAVQISVIHQVSY